MMIGRKVFLVFLFGIFIIFTGFLIGRSPNESLREHISPRSKGAFPIVPSISESKESSSLTKTVATEVKVVKVIDGDTIEVQFNNQTETVRLIGIDTPETVDPRKPVQCFGKEASDKAKSLLNNQTVKLEPDIAQGERDKYGRLLRYVFLDGVNFNQLMISTGFAHEYTYRSNPYKYQIEFRQAEQDARNGKKGLWADNVCP